ncbi:MAG TPA: hypothetical protein VL240_14685 [Candidatus Binatia bacterium]|nr:hypothetical protein [Candidatus Binatia bacterium]
MNRRAVALACCIMLAGTLAWAQYGDEGYQMARVVAFERVAENAQHPENADRYKISMLLGNTVYNCYARGPASTFIDWSPGKEFPTRLGDKVLLVKSPNGQIVELSIVGRKMAK